MPRTMASYLSRFEELGAQTAFAERQGYRTVRWSYSEIASMAYGFANELASREIHKGDRVMLWGANSAAWVAAFFGCASRGVIAVPMDDAASTEFALRVFKHVEAKLLVCSCDHSRPEMPALLLESMGGRQ